MRFGAVIAAAGLSSRMGAFKPLLPLGGVTFIGRIISVLREGGAGDIAVVTGRDAEAVESALKDSGVEFIRNREFLTTDMFHSVRLGFSALAHRVDALFFSPADAPLFSVSTVRTLASYLTEGRTSIVTPTFGGKKGHPIALLASVAQELIHSQSPGGLRGALDTCGKPQIILEIDDPGVAMDADTPEDYEKMLRFVTRATFFS
jgi:CTP:molybdopterin cytidylyltransferase MocA